MNHPPQPEVEDCERVGTLRVAPRDQLGRQLSSLRISVTDRCNLRCSYCMPEKRYSWLPRRDLLSFEEIARLTDVFCGLGVRKVRLTGGEPLLRRDLAQLIARLGTRTLVDEIALTTNGVLLGSQSTRLRAAGLGRITVSLDTLDPKRYRAMTGRDEHAQVLFGLDAARAAGFRRSKINMVVMRGVNDDELEDLVRFGREKRLEIRFIEYMDVGGATRWDRNLVVSREQMLARLKRAFGGARPVMPRSTGDARDSAPAQRFLLGDGSVVGIVASTTRPFCGACDRSRLTADGTWLRCLYARLGTDLRSHLRGGASNAELSALIEGAWRKRADQGAQRRLLERERRPLADAPTLRADPHLEMHTRGG